MFGSLREPLKLCFILGSHCFCAKLPSKLEGRQRFWPLQCVRRIELDCPARDDMAANQIQTRQKKGKHPWKTVLSHAFLWKYNAPSGQFNTAAPPQKRLFDIIYLSNMPSSNGMLDFQNVQRVPLSINGHMFPLHSGPLGLWSLHYQPSG